MENPPGNNAKLPADGGNRRLSLLIGVVVVAIALFQYWQSEPVREPVEPAGDRVGSEAPREVPRSPQPQDVETARQQPQVADSDKPRGVEPSRAADRVPPRATPRNSPAGVGASAKVPSKVMAVLAHVDETGEPLAGYEGGRRFLNLGRDGEEKLPERDARRRPIEYREWDVNPHLAGRNRGAERLITGSDGGAFYTNDHYRTFQRIR